MTACVNRKHTKKVAAVVTASLVGALSLGVAPVAAMATDEGIEMQAADWSTGAKVTSATDGKGASVTGDLERKSFTAKSGKFLVPTEVTGTFVTTQVDESMLTYNGGHLSNADIDTARNFFAWNAERTTPYTGTYTVTITTDGGSYTVPFKIVGEGKIEGVTVKGTPTYNGKDQSSTLTFVDADGYEVTPDGTVSYTDAKGTPVTPENAGSYVASFTVDGNPYSVSFSIAKLDLWKSTVMVEDTTTAIASDADLLSKVVVNGGAAGDFAGDLKVTKVTNPSGGAGFGTAKGQYQVTVASNDATNVTGSAVINYCVLDNDVADSVVYGRTTPSDGQTLTIDLAYGDVFNASNTAVKDASGNTYKGDQLEITYTDLDNNETVDASALGTVGSYKLTIRVKPTQDFATNDWSGGTISIKVDVKAVQLDDSKDLAFFFDGELAGSSETVTYDGTDQLERVSTVVKGSDGENLVEGIDYKITVKNVDTGKEVDSIVNAGTYEIKVTPLTFEFSGSGDTLTLTVSPVQIGARVAQGSLKDFLGADAVAYTGSAVTIPGVQYPVLNADGTVKTDKDGKVVYAGLDADLYNVVSIKGTDGKVVKEAVEEDAYTVKIALSDAAAGNYVINDDNFKVEVREYGHFSDVDSSKWYAVPVEKAYEQLYINGISGTNLFAPEANITRADAVCILFNMAGGDTKYGQEDFQYNEVFGYNTGFTDVDGHTYFAKALAWAKAFGVANGSNGEFRPYDDITREEFASLLANYAKAMGKFEAADASALDSVSDANTVSGWAKDNVAWAVANKVMGNGGFVAGQSDITRAEVAAMAVNYQPENLTGEDRH